MRGFRTDLKAALRVFRRSPGFAAVIVLTLGLGIGANSATFSAVNGVLLQPLPFDEGGQLVRVRHGGVDAGIQPGNLSPLEIADYRDGARTLAGIVEYHTMFFNLLEDGVEPERTQVGVVSWNYFDLLGVRPIHGRSFTPEEDVLGADPVLILGHAYWQRRFGGDPSVIGTVVQMNNRPHEIVGVLPPIPTYPNDNDVWMPWYACPFRAGDGWNLDRSARGLTTIARVAPGLTVEQVDADLSRVARDLHHEHTASYPQAVDSVDATVVPLKEELTAGARPTFLVLIAMSGLVLLIACANVANLMLARINGRQQEIAVRSALGAGRGRILRHLATESVLLAMAGAVVALGVAYLSVGALSAFASGLTPRFQEVRVDGWVLAFTVLTALVTGVVVGALPAGFRTPMAERLREAKGSGGLAGQRVRGALVVSQVAVAFVLLVGAGLMLRSLSNLLSVDPGYRSEGVLGVTVDLDWARYTTPQDGRAFFRSVLERLEARPDVVSAAVASDYPMSGARFQSSAAVVAEGADTVGARPPELNLRFVTPGYFETLGMTVLKGRAFEAADDEGGPLVAVLSAGAARRLFGTQDPLGRRVSSTGTTATVVGIVGDVRQAGLDSEAAEEVYLPYFQAGFGRQLLVRTAVPPMMLARALREEVYAVDPNQPVSFVQTLDEAQAASAESPRTIALLLSIFAAIAMATAAAGIASVISYSVAQRRREIGIRMALGARRSRVASVIVRGGLLTVVLGLALGLVGALLLTRMLEGLLFGVRPSDPLTLVAVGTAFLVVGGSAALIPALRGTRIQPIEALRADA